MHTPQQHKFGFKAWIPTIGLAFAAFVFNTSEFLPVGLLPNIAESIHESVSKTGLIITVYAWVVSLLSLPLTILTAKLERRRLLLWLIVIFALSHFVVLWADTFEKLMGARVCVAVTHSIFWSIMTPLAARVAPFGKQAFRLGGGDGRLDCRNGAGRSDRNPSRTASRLAGILLHRGYGSGIGLGHYFFLAACLYQQSSRFFKESSVLV